MSSPRRPYPPRGYHTCDCGKRCYYTKSAAKRVRRIMGDSGLSVYRCPHSDTWHIGHKPRPLVRGEISRDEITTRPRGAA